MEEWLTTIVARIADGTLLPTAYFRSLDCDTALDARDSEDIFVTEWTRLFNELNHRWTESEVLAKQRELAEEIRRESFLAVSRATRQHEIASYVSDDFDLIVRSKLIGLNEPLLAQLWEVYQRGEFPYPPFERRAA